MLRKDNFLAARPSKQLNLHIYIYRHLCIEKVNKIICCQYQDQAFENQRNETRLNGQVLCWTVPLPVVAGQAEPKQKPVATIRKTSGDILRTVVARQTHQPSNYSEALFNLERQAVFELLGAQAAVRPGV